MAKSRKRGDELIHVDVEVVKVVDAGLLNLVRLRGPDSTNESPAETKQFLEAHAVQFEQQTKALLDKLKLRGFYFDVASSLAAAREALVVQPSSPVETGINSVASSIVHSIDELICFLRDGDTASALSMALLTGHSLGVLKSLGSGNDVLLGRASRAASKAGARAANASRSKSIEKKLDRVTQLRAEYASHSEKSLVLLIIEKLRVSRPTAKNYLALSRAKSPSVIAQKR